MKTTSVNTDPYYPNQPDRCFVALTSHPLGVGCVRRGFQGYAMVYDYSAQLETLGYDAVVAAAEHVTDRMNAALGITKGQAMAALIGSMRGWHVPGADPAKWTEDGRAIPSRASVAA